MFIPKSLTKRYSVVAVGVFDWWLEEISSGMAHERGKVATLFLRVFNFLLTRDCRNLKSSALQELPENHDVAVALQIRSRLQQMEAGLWLVVLDEAIEDTRQVSQNCAERRVVAASVDTEAITTRNMETCVFKVMHGDVRTGQRVLQSPCLHPPCQETVDLMCSKFITSTDGGGSILSHALKQRALVCKPCFVKDTVLAKLIGNLTDCKTAGGSGWRNSRIKAIASTPDGLRVLTAWVRMWITAKVPEHMAHEWRGVLGIPLRKGVDGFEIRPILIGESLMSLPGAYLQFATQSKVSKLLSKTQFGIGVTAGAETMLGVVKALTKLCPADALAALDMVNAFGEVLRAEVLEEVIF